MRRKIFNITADAIIQLFSAGVHRPYRVVRDPLPADSRIVDCRFNGFDRNVVSILIESSEFPQVPEGQLFPPINPLLQSFIGEEL
jgi:hypothetical protein